jgi:endothelin-converting enzyme/putative endopeptidase
MRISFLCLVLAASLRVAAAPAETPLRALPYTPGFDLAAMDRTADACVDFYQYACGGWMRDNPIPSDQASWDVYRKMGEDNRRFLWGLLADLAPGKPGRDADQRRAGDYFAACMDETGIVARGREPLRPLLARVDALDSKLGLAPLLAQLFLVTGDAGLFFAVGSGQDYAHSTRVIPFASAGGLGLPDRDYYTREDEHSKGLRAKYVLHVQRTLVLLGESGEQAAHDAATVMRIETALAQATLTQVQLRDPYATFHMADRAALSALVPAFDWDTYLRKLGLGRVREIDVTQPGFFKAFEKVLEDEKLGSLRAYLRWHVASAVADGLDPPMVAEHFDFYSRILHGVPEQRPRWKRCVALVNVQLGDALGKEFVRHAFAPPLKAKALAMTRQIEAAMGADLEALGWMSPDTKRQALAKLATMMNKIGYPNRWRDYSKLRVSPRDFFGNLLAAQEFEVRRDLAKIGRPLDRGEWQMPATTVNAYYDPQLNSINFPAGVLQPPLYDPRIDDAPNYGNTGGTIGHELTHGFDDEGRQFDAQGNLRDWWTKDDAKAFQDRADCIVEQYGRYVIVDDIRINSRLTLGEDIADLGGLLLAWNAWHAEIAAKKPGPRDGFTPEQRFFIGYSQWACENQRPENQRALAITDPHSPTRYRVNGVMANIPAWQGAFSCRAGQPMVSAKPCRVW